jgi:hypothetical protein
MAEEGSGIPGKPKRPISYPVLLAIIIAAWGIWFGGSWVIRWDAAGELRSSTKYEPPIKLCRLELELRSIAIKRFAERTGRLPQSLTECDSDGLHIDDWLSWAKENLTRGDDLTLNFIVAHPDRLDEPWTPLALRAENALHEDKLPQGPRTSVAQDLFGLPIVYEKGHKPRHDLSWVGSSDALSPEIEKFVAAQGVVPTPAPGEFALSSLFVRNTLSHFDDLAYIAWLAPFSLLWGNAIFAVTFVGIIVKWRRSRVKQHGKVWIVNAGLIAGVMVFFSLAKTSATCYVTAPFRSSFLSRAKRLEILEKSVKSGEIPQDVADRARGYIENLPENDR